MNKRLQALGLLLLTFPVGCSRVASTPKNPTGTTSANQTLERNFGVGISSVALVARGNASPQQFVRMEAEQTNLDFVHQWKPPPHDFDFRTLLNGGGACIGDYDGDGRADVYLTRPAGGNRLYRNLGDFRFASGQMDCVPLKFFRRPGNRLLDCAAKSVSGRSTENSTLEYRNEGQ